VFLEDHEIDFPDPFDATPRGWPVYHVTDQRVLLFVVQRVRGISRQDYIVAGGSLAMSVAHVPKPQGIKLFGKFADARQSHPLTTEPWVRVVVLVLSCLRISSLVVLYSVWAASVVVRFLFHSDILGFVGKKLPNSSPLREPTNKHITWRI
jgi:hypothetical protein